jgi:hypothetical protein
LDYSWLDTAATDKTFFTLVNTSGNTIKKGEQIWRCYGRQSNLGLMLNYAFAYSENPYDYCEIKIRGTNWKFYLKMHMLNDDLLSSIKNLNIHQVGSNELLIMQKYQMIVSDHLKYYERLQSAEEDSEFLRFEGQKIDPQIKYAIVYRLERKQILSSQMRLCEFLIQFLSSKNKLKDDYMRPTKEEELEMKEAKG